MAEDNKNTEKLKNAAKTGEGFVKGVKSYYSQLGSKLFLETKAGKVNVGQYKPSGKPQSIFRLEAGHPGTNTNFNHINLNKQISGLKIAKTKPNGKIKMVKYDPHTPLPPGGLQAAEATAKVCQFVNTANKVLVPIAIAIDTCRVGYAGYQDYQNGTTRNVVETGASVAGGWVGGYGGAVGGAAIGTAFLPGLGTIIGGIIGGLSGGVTGAVATGKAVGAVSDKIEYNIEEIECESCKKKFKARKYLAEKYCPQCVEKLSGTDEVKPIKGAKVEHKIEKFECDNCKTNLNGINSTGKEPCLLCVGGISGCDENSRLIDKKTLYLR